MIKSSTRGIQVGRVTRRLADDSINVEESLVEPNDIKLRSFNKSDGAVVWLVLWRKCIMTSLPEPKDACVRLNSLTLERTQEKQKGLLKAKW